MTTPTQRTLRIVDAGLNRAREGLRVLEDLARFALDDPKSSADAKDLRHELALAGQNLPVSTAARLHARDTPGDVGTVIATELEGTRPSQDAVAAAAAGRTAEALRSLEEAAKVLGVSGQPFEQLRYRTYTLEKQIRLQLCRPVCDWKLCVLITASLCRLPWQQVVDEAIAGGADCIQLREKDLDDRTLLDRATELVKITKQQSAVIINDRPDIALLAGATGVHLGQTDLEASGVIKMFGRDLIVGVSCSSVEQARIAIKAGADYLGLGPMFETTTKHKPHIAGPTLIADCLNDPLLSHAPHLAIGGITPDNVSHLRDRGCRGVAVCSSVCKAEDPQRICKALRAYIDKTAVDTPTGEEHA